MFRIFRKRNKKEQSSPSVFQKISTAVEKFHRRWANYLNRKTENIKTSTLKVLLFIFCALFGSICIYTGLDAIRQPSTVIKVDKIQFPSHTIIKNEGTAHQQSEILSAQEYENIQSFKRYMDSLKNDKSGKASYDSIITERPGLMDSISLAESLYLKQLK
ncbi:MAG: hypothetical protein E6Q36_07425 [Chryseobacterium sp.]|nr:MAG: hypothetical protein E6Q36_07425 [Chryseobacterium sp.]